MLLWRKHRNPIFWNFGIAVLFSDNPCRYECDHIFTNEIFILVRGLKAQCTFKRTKCNTASFLPSSNSQNVNPSCFDCLNRSWRWNSRCNLYKLSKICYTILFVFQKIFKVPTDVDLLHIMVRERRMHTKFLVTETVAIIGSLHSFLLF